MALKVKDFKITFTRSSGAGGQNVNKVETCVVIKHLPSGLVVRCDKHRSQLANRLEALRILEQKLAALEFKQVALAKARQAKLKRQQQRRSLLEREKLLKSKQLHSAKKLARQKTNWD